MDDTPITLNEITFSGESSNLYEDYLDLGDTFANIRNLEAKESILNLIRVLGATTNQPSER